MLVYPVKLARSLRGFTLIEILVVLVILALTTSLMSQGLNTTWRNFERLSSRGLINSSAQLPIGWFEQSIKGAVLYHPEKPDFSGDATTFKFITFNTPDDANHVPQIINWKIDQGDNRWTLSFSRGESMDFVMILSWPQSLRFEYLIGDIWGNTFEPINSQLPKAIRIVSGEGVWAIGKIGREPFADVPAELAYFGKYEF